MVFAPARPGTLFPSLAWVAGAALAIPGPARSEEPAPAAASAISRPAATSATSAPDRDGLPQSVATSHFELLTANSPFTRSLNLSDSLILTGIAVMDGKKVATLMNKETKETYVVSDLPNPQGWKMVEVAGNDELDKVAAKISVDGGEVVTVRYSDWALKPGEAKPATGGGGEIREGERRGFGRGEGRGDGRPSFGPSPEIRAKMEALPEEKRRQLFDHMMKLRTEKPDMSWEDRGKEFQKALERLEKSK